MTQPIVLIGAARSGTKIVRDALAEAAGCGRVPYDIGFVWRYRNERAESDILDPATVTPRIRSFVRDYIERYATDGSLKVIEKTVGNALRLPFVHAVLPDAVFVHLVRDGVDVSESIRRQWLAPAGGRYVMAKMRHFPLRLVPSYGRKYTAAQLHRIARKSRVGTWGPRYPGIDQDVRRESLLTVSARQWRTSVEYAASQLPQIGVPYFDVRYEDIVADPPGTLAALLDDLGLPYTDKNLLRTASRFDPGRVGRGATSLTSEELTELDREIRPVLCRLGYPSAVGHEVNDV
ncbi:hypothetical protein GCM10011575_47060 [Microlunatus endophyticus]|uniref:Sulfotransferase family protein n=1 Tax=Microlunatus endophyticus TaxID=1716077 RepID=A0A917SHZ0_9ACTN|nr:sulfotransferase [Microlunatus endophyticus]GGL83327.1 hypothetical protein GCM10011575_47060 [Microlunatus endophyticus]